MARRPSSSSSRQKSHRRSSCVLDCVVVPSREEEDQHRLALQEIFDDYIEKVTRQGKRGQQDQGAARQWFTRHAESQFPGIGSRALSVPPYFTGHYQPGLDRHVYVSSPVGTDRLLELATESEGKVEKNDIKGDWSQRLVGRLFRCLNASLERDGQTTMFIISQLCYDNMLSVLYRDVVNRKKPKQKGRGKNTKEELISSDLKKKLELRGDLDVMIVHQELGVLMVQVKAAGDEHVSADLDDSYAGREDDIRGALEKAMKQLKRDAEIFDLAMGNPRDCQVTKVIAVPNVSRQLVTKLTPRNRDYGDIKFLCKDDMFADDIRIPESETKLEHFGEWWRQLPRKRRPISLDRMKEIVGRYVGLLSTAVTLKPFNEMTFLRQFKDCVYHTFCLYHRLVLSRAQVRVLGELKTQREQQRDYLSGPPGSGKTLVLTLRARTFLADSAEHHVIVINMYRGAEGRAIGEHVHKSIGAGDCFKGRVHPLPVDVGELTLDAFVQKVRGLYPGFDEKKTLFVIDEIYIESFWSDILVSFTEHFPSSSVLCAGLFSKNPQGFQEHPLDVVHRCPPSVQCLLYHVDWSEERKKTYVKDCGHTRELSTNGPTPLCVRHKQHEGGRVAECRTCAVELADVLEKEGLVRASFSLEGEAACAPAAAAAQPTAEPLKDCKIVILVNIPRERYNKSGSYIETTDEAYESYMQYISTCAFVQTLKERGMDVDTKVELGSKDLEDLPQAQGRLFATWLYNFQGLEAGVVVFLPGDEAGEELPGVNPGEELPGVKPGEELSGVSPREELSGDKPGELPGVKPGEELPRPAAEPRTSVACREIPTPGLRAVRGREGIKQSPEQAASTERGPEPSLAGVPQTSRGKAARAERPYTGQSELCWTRADIARFSPWDQTNLMVAGSRCLSLLILLVP